MRHPSSDHDKTSSAAGLTVVFATRNRASALPAVLNSFCALVAPEGGFKLIVVDNGSTDATAAVVEAYADRLPLLMLSEPRSGKNRALNVALPHIEGSLVILTDDDILPRPDWLTRLQQAAEAHPEAAFFGGTILPHWSRPKPAWLTEGAVPFSVLYSQQKRGAGACSYDAIFGPNMAVRKSLFDAGFRFSETVGPNETQHLYPMGSETEFLRRVEKAGHSGRFVADAVVEHIIRPEQIDESWILQRGYRFGFGEGYNYIVRNPGLAGALRWLPPQPRLRARALIYDTVARLVRPLPRSPFRLKTLYKARQIAGANDSARQRAGLLSNPGRKGL